MAPTEVERIGQEPFVVGADVEQHRQRSRRVDATDRAVQRELADRDPHAARAEVTEAEDPLAVRHHDHVDIGVVTQHVVEQVGDAIAVGPRQVQPVLLPIDPRPLLAGEAHGRGVHDGQQLGEMPPQVRIEEHRVPLLQQPQEDVPAEVGALGAVLDVDPFELVVERLDHGREEPVQSEAIALLPREGGAFVQVSVPEQLPTGGAFGGFVHPPSVARITLRCEPPSPESSTVVSAAALGEVGLPALGRRGQLGSGVEHRLHLLPGLLLLVRDELPREVAVMRPVPLRARDARPSPCGPRRRRRRGPWSAQRRTCPAAVSGRWCRATRGCGARRTRSRAAPAPS